MITLVLPFFREPKPHLFVIASAFQFLISPALQILIDGIKAIAHFFNPGQLVTGMDKSPVCFSCFSDLGLFLQYAFLCSEPKEVFFTIAAFGDNKPQRNSVIWGIGGDYPPTSRIANVYTFALLARSELIVNMLTAL